ncbi:MAG TPA: hypothetical protein VH080_05220 [Gemmatimonadaceae bacterium]|jgi:hypothetical protein|nr:hypothetical protein [Gemmatimonadaceae bacterium]
MDTIKLFRVEKLRRAVRVVLTDGRRLDGDVFLAERTRIRAEPQEPIDLLNEDAPFFPFYLSEQELLLVAKSQVTRVETAAPEGDPSADMPDGAMAVEITLIDGSTISGFVPLEKRGEQTRLLDFLNGYVKRFMPVFWGEQVCLVNRLLIATVSQLT